MAGDIVKQLRDTRYPGQMEMRLAAADEIERLRNARPPYQCLNPQKCPEYGQCLSSACRNMGKNPWDWT